MKKIIIAILTLMVMATVGMLQSRIKYPTGRDTYRTFGDGRCQMYRGGNISFGCHGENDISNSIISDIEKYVVRKPNIYIIGYYKNGYGIRGDEKIYSYIDIKTGEYKYYEGLTLEDIPRYTILNYKTLEMRNYKTLEEVPEEERALFNRKVWFGCSNLFKRTCFEKHGNKDSRLE